MFAALLLLLILTPAPRPAPPACPVVGVWRMTWGRDTEYGQRIIQPHTAFHADGRYVSEPRGSGHWSAEGMTVYFTEGGSGYRLELIEVAGDTILALGGTTTGAAIVPVLLEYEAKRAD